MQAVMGHPRLASDYPAGVCSVGARQVHVATQTGERAAVRNRIGSRLRSAAGRCAAPPPGFRQGQSLHHVNQRTLELAPMTASATCSSRYSALVARTAVKNEAIGIQPANPLGTGHRAAGPYASARRYDEARVTHLVSSNGSTAGRALRVCMTRARGRPVARRSPAAGGPARRGDQEDRTRWAGQGRWGRCHGLCTFRSANRSANAPASRAIAPPPTNAHPRPCRTAHHQTGTAEPCLVTKYARHLRETPPGPRESRASCG